MKKDISKLLNSKLQLFLPIKLVAVCIVVFLMSCQNENRVSSTISFPVSTDYDFLGTIQVEDETYIGFVKRNFNPNIKLFDTKGNLKDSVSLNDAERKIDVITDVWMYSLDSVCLYSNFNGMLLVVNRKGELVAEKNYYTITDRNERHYDLLPSHPLYPFSTNNKREVVFSTWMWSGESEQTPQERLDDVRNGFLLCKINPFQNEEAAFGARFSDIRELAEISNQSLFFMPAYKAYIVNDRFILASFYSQYLYRLSDNLLVEDAVKIIDDEYGIIKPIPMTRKGSIQDKANESVAMCRDATYVANILYNNEKDEYTVVLKTGKSDLADYSSCKILMYDTDFRKIREFDSSGSDYLPQKSFILSGKLYMEKKNESHNVRVYENIEVF